MSTNTVEAFLAKANQDKDLQEKVKAALQKTADELSKLSENAGMPVAAETFLAKLM